MSSIGQSDESLIAGLCDLVAQLLTPVDAHNRRALMLRTTLAVSILEHINDFIELLQEAAA